MSRNRKNQSSAVRFKPAMKAAVLCALIGGAALGYVWQKNQNIELGSRYQLGERRLKELKLANTKLSRQLDTLRLPAFLERRAKELNLQLVQPSQAQILRLVEAPPGEAAAGSDLLLVGRPPGSPPPARQGF
jgi:hypothetical protein